MSKLKVLYLTGLSSLTGGGGNKRVYEILKRCKKYNIEYLPVIDKKNYFSALETFPDVKKIVEESGGYLVDLRPRNELFFSLYGNIPKVSSKIAKIAKNEKVDIIITAHESFDLIYVAWLSSKLSSIPWSAIFQLTPIVGTIRNIAFGPLSALKNSAAYGNMLKIFIRYSKLLSITRNLRETLSLSVSFSIPFELKIFDPKLDIKVLNPSLGVDEAVYYTKACDIDFDAIYFARLHPLKGLFDIPLIWKKVVEVKPYAKLIVAGSWQNKIYEYEFYKLCRKLNLLNNIKYVGFLPKEILYSYVKSAKVLLYPSYLDSFPLTVLETLACGIPVIACNINPIRLTYRTDAVIKVYTNDLNKFAENVITVLEDEALRKKLSQNALAFASKYDWDSAAKEEFNSIQTILNYWAGK